MNGIIKMAITYVVIGAATMAGAQLWNSTCSGKFDEVITKAKTKFKKGE